MQELRQLYQFIYDKINSNYIYKEDVIKGYVYALLYNIYSLSYIDSQMEVESTEDKLGTSRQMEIYNRFIEEVQNHYVDEHKIGFYADKLCITPKYLTSRLQGKRSFCQRLYQRLFVDGSQSPAQKWLYYPKYLLPTNFNSPTFFSRFFKMRIRGIRLLNTRLKGNTKSDC